MWHRRAGPNVGSPVRMARPPRLTYPGAIHHAMARSNDQRLLFTDDDDRRAFLDRMAVVREMFEVDWQMFVLMNTHFHSKVKTPHGNISQAMQYLLSKFAQWWNRRRDRRGHLLDARYKAPIVEEGHYALHVVRYIALNPVKAKYVAHASEWPWSSHRGLAGIEAPADFLEINWLRDVFDGLTLRDCQRQYRHYVDETESDPIEPIDPMFEGSPALAADVRARIAHEMHRTLVPRRYRALARPDLESLFLDNIGDLERRNQTIIRAQVLHGYTQSEIARSLDLHPNTVSKITMELRRKHRSLVRGW